MRQLLIIIAILFCAAPVQALQQIDTDQTWSGAVTLSEETLVRPGAVLTIAPGTTVTCQAGAALVISGGLQAVGSAKQPIRFLPASGVERGGWKGLSFQLATGESALIYLEIKGAAHALEVSGSRVRLRESLFEEGGKGAFFAVDAQVDLHQVTIRDMSEGGIEGSVRSRGKISGCRLENTGPFAIQIVKQAAFSIKENEISGTKLGISVSGDFQPVEGNRIAQCDVGIAITQANPSNLVRGNQLSGCRIGIGCQQFASPTLSENILEECETGIECYQGSSPQVRNNRFSRNKQGLACIQMCNPQVELNEFLDNDIGVYLHLSSYALIHENNFYRNRLHIQLDNMSYDWELRALKKPTRNRQVQNQVLVKKGKAQAEELKVNVVSEGFVDARGNYWGEATTAELKHGGSDINLASIHDGQDEPTRSYEGWPGEYKIDLVNIDDWKEQAVAGAGLPAQ